MARKESKRPKRCRRRSDDDWIRSQLNDILKLRRHARAIDPNSKQDEALAELQHDCELALLKWRLAAPALIEFALDVLENSRPDSREAPARDPVARRRPLRRWLGRAGVLVPPQRDCDPYVPVLLPRSLFRQLKEGLEALDHGEALPLLEPRETTPRDRYSIVKEKLRAWEHIYFLNGRGVSLEVAIDQVGGAFNTTRETLVDWRDVQLVRAYGEDQVFDRLEHARVAGALDLQLELDPEIGARPGEFIQADTLELRDKLRTDTPQSAHARYYRELAGKKPSEKSRG